MEINSGFTMHFALGFGFEIFQVQTVPIKTGGTIETNDSFLLCMGSGEPQCGFGGQHVAIKPVEPFAVIRYRVKGDEPYGSCLVGKYIFRADHKSLGGDDDAEQIAAQITCEDQQQSIVHAMWRQAEKESGSTMLFTVAENSQSPVSGADKGVAAEDKKESQQDKKPTGNREIVTAIGVDPGHQAHVTHGPEQGRVTIQAEIADQGIQGEQQKKDDGQVDGSCHFPER